MTKPDHAAVVLGMYETGLGVARSLGRAGVRVLGLDVRGDVGFRSRYVEASICPDPLHDEEAFVEHLIELASREAHKPVLFVTSDHFPLAVARHRARLEDWLLINLPDTELLQSISDKYRQYQLAMRAGVPAPATYVMTTLADIDEILQSVPLPAFVKAREVTSWRSAIGGNVKGFIAKTVEDLGAHLERLYDCGVECVVQELIPGPDTNHFKACCYLTRDGEVVRSFALQKLRQQPPGFGFGSLVESVYDEEVLELGKKLLQNTGYQGVGSAEFKRDDRDGQLKLIELNPRYWQQIALAERCQVNFPLAHYHDLTGTVSANGDDYEREVKWLNVMADLDSFRVYRDRGELDLDAWLRSLSGPKVYSTFAADDPVPGIRAVAANLAARRPTRALLRRFRRALEDGR